MFFLKKPNSELEKFAGLLERGVSALFKERGDITFSDQPEKIKKNIIEYNGKMRGDGIDKFNHEPTYVSAVNFYKNEKEMAKNKAVGALIVYVQQVYIAQLMRKLQYPPVNDESEDAMLDSCGTLCNIISGRVKTEIASAGYIELEMSHFKNYRNTAFDGVDFCYSEFDMYEINFKIDQVKRLVIDMTIGTLPRR
jgi:hypothetical protein